jgi:hypothetical protein
MADLLHTPTPWHNCVFQFVESPIIYVGKSSIPREALRAELVSGGWTTGNSGMGGGYFELKERPDEQSRVETLKQHAAFEIPLKGEIH